MTEESKEAQLDGIALLKLREWLQEAITDRGAKPYGMGISCEGSADISFDMDGYSYNVSIHPV